MLLAEPGTSWLLWPTGTLLIFFTRLCPSLILWNDANVILSDHDMSSQPQCKNLSTVHAVDIAYMHAASLTQCHTVPLSAHMPLLITLHIGPRQNPETYPVSKLAQAMWSDSEADAIQYLNKAGLEPEQASNGAWQLVLHRALKVDAQAASFRQRSARLCNQQKPVRSQNVLEQGRQAEAAVRDLLASSSRQLPQLPQLQVASADTGRHDDTANLQTGSETPQAHSGQVGVQPVHASLVDMVLVAVRVN